MMVFQADPSSAVRGASIGYEGASTGEFLSGVVASCSHLLHAHTGVEEDGGAAHVVDQGVSAMTSSLRRIASLTTMKPADARRGSPRTASPSTKVGWSPWRIGQSGAWGRRGRGRPAGPSVGPGRRGRGSRRVPGPAATSSRGRVVSASPRTGTSHGEEPPAVVALRHDFRGISGRQGHRQAATGEIYWSAPASDGLCGGGGAVGQVGGVLAERLGHSSVVVALSIYAHVFEQDDQAAAELTAAAVYGS